MAGVLNIDSSPSQNGVASAAADQAAAMQVYIVCALVLALGAVALCDTCALGLQAAGSHCGLGC